MSFSHKFYVSICQVEVNRKTKALEISMRLFAHDLEDAVFKAQKEKLLLGSKKENPKVKEIIEEYLVDNFKIIQEEKSIKYKFLGYELENDIIWLYVESGISLKSSKLEVSNNVIVNLYEDQKNIVNFKDKSKTQSQICTKSKPLHSFDL